MLLQVMRNLPNKHQTLLFSATMPVEIEALAQVMMHFDIIYYCRYYLLVLDQ